MPLDYFVIRKASILHHLNLRLHLYLTLIVSNMTDLVCVKGMDVHDLQSMTIDLLLSLQMEIIAR